MANVEIAEVHTDIEITEPVGSLDPADVKKLVALVMEHMQAQQHQNDLRRQDDRVSDRAFQPDVRQ
jgi:hypothetical protein